MLKDKLVNLGILVCLHLQDLCFAAHFRFLKGVAQLLFKVLLHGPKLLLVLLSKQRAGAAVLILGLAQHILRVEGRLFYAQLQGIDLTKELCLASAVKVLLCSQRLF
eukprot:XP_001704303.1 Hypothetical protein GL50803_94724 [Giardia lamblia ATCC 50803]